MLKSYDWVMTLAFYEQEKALLTLESISDDVRISHDARKNLEQLEHAWNKQHGYLNKEVLNRCD